MTLSRWDASRRDELLSRWPNRSASRFVQVATLEWHVQVAGTGPILFLAHGTGAASFSWADLLPLLATRFTVVAPDLPGHGLTAGAGRSQLSLPGLAAACQALLRTLDLTPVAAVGHSAGAAVLLQMAVDRSLTPERIIGLNPALVPPPASYRLLLGPLVHRVAISELVARGAAALARHPAVVDSLLRSTGSSVPAASRDLYREMTRSEQHVHDVLSLMSGWDLTALAQALPAVECAVDLVVGSADSWIPRRALARLASRIPHVTISELPGGHLLHEEHPDLVGRFILDRLGADPG